MIDENDALYDFWIIDAETGEPRNARSRSELHEFFASDRRILARSVVGERLVSTVFLPIDHAFGDGPPVLWETMVFWQKAGQAMRTTDFQRRYTSCEAALQGHAETVGALERGEEPEEPAEPESDSAAASEVKS